MNALEEISKYLDNIKAATIQCTTLYDDYDRDKEYKSFNLYEGYTEEEFKAFKEFMNFNAVPVDILDGIIWLKDDISWVERIFDYDGYDQGWRTCVMPELLERINDAKNTKS